jgi:2'-hydroxyisoflavone reductase
MEVLLLGGTAWLGSTIAAAAVRNGHDVTCLARGEAVPDGARLVRADRDHDSALDAVGAQRWDAVIDVARQPGQVRRAVRDLAVAADRYVFVSTVNVYASQKNPGGDEDAALLPPLEADAMGSPDDYGPAKVACEEAVRAGFGVERSAIVRAGLIGGPGDPSGRTTYWPHRFAHPSNPEGAVLVPDAPEVPTALIDVRDLAAWLVRLAAGGAGTFNALGVASPLSAHLALARSVAAHTGPLVSAPEDWLATHGVAEWSGPRSLPLWLTDRDWYGMNVRSTARARAHGLTLRPLADTLTDALAAGHAPGAGLTDADERELLAALAA